MEKNGIVPDVVDVVPKAVLSVEWNGVKCDMGNILTPTQVKDPPIVKWESEQGALYTLCMTDPDAPNRKTPKFREWHHWLVVNIPGGDLSNGEVMSAYVGSGPPKDSGLHRYVLLLYKQPKKIRCDEPRLTNKSGNNRGNFSIRKFAKKYKLGEPVAGNFFQAQWDDYVPTLYKQLAGK